MLLGAVRKKSAAGDWACRGSIHVCLLGDPATAKSTLLRWVSSVWPHAIYVSGSSATVPGLTAAVVDDDGKTLKPGALIQASGSVCCIDDFQHLDHAGHSAIGGVMDHQALHVAKAGIQTRLGADTSVLVACLPRGFCYDAFKPVRANVDMPEGVWQCFDLVHVLQDAGNGDDDDNIASHIVAAARSAPRSGFAEIALPDMLRYISFARTIDPELSSEASEQLKMCYSSFREGGKANPRLLESLIRLSEAVARGNLDNSVKGTHVKEAFKLMMASRGLDREFIGLARESKRARHSGA